MQQRDPIYLLTWGGALVCLFALADHSLELAGAAILIGAIGGEWLALADWRRSATPLDAEADLADPPIEQTAPQRYVGAVAAVSAMVTIGVVALADRPLSRETLETAGFFLVVTVIAIRVARYAAFGLAAGEDWIELRRAGRRRRWEFATLTGVERGRTLDQVRVTRLAFDDGTRLSIRGIGSLKLGLTAPDDVGYRIARRAARALSAEALERLEAGEPIGLGPVATARISAVVTWVILLIVPLAVAANVAIVMTMLLETVVGVPPVVSLTISGAVTLWLLITWVRGRKASSLVRRVELRRDGVYPGSGEVADLQPIRWPNLAEMRGRGMLLTFVAADDGRELACSGDHPNVPLATELVSRLAPDCKRTGLVR